MIDRLIAMKFIVDNSLHDSIREQSLTEPHAAMRARHPNIVTYHVSETGEVKPFDYEFAKLLLGTASPRPDATPSEHHRTTYYCPI